MKNARSVLAIAAAASLACGDGVGPMTHLARARMKWEQAGIDTYALRVLRGCGECLAPTVTGPVRVSVRAGAIESRAYEDGTPVSDSYASLFPDVPGLFAVIEDAIRQDAAKLTVSYHPVYGIPINIYIDYHAMMVDDETGWSVGFFPPE